MPPKTTETIHVTFELTVPLDKSFGDVAVALEAAPGGADRRRRPGPCPARSARVNDLDTEEVAYTFLLRAGYPIRLVLPSDLTHAEVDRCARYMHALVLDPARELAPAPAAPAQLPPAAVPAMVAAPGPVPALAPGRPPARVFQVNRVTRARMDLWSTGYVAKHTSPADAARVVEGQLPVWEVIEATAGRTDLRFGSVGGAVAEGTTITSGNERARTVLVLMEQVEVIGVTLPPDVLADFRAGRRSAAEIMAAIDRGELAVQADPSAASPGVTLRIGHLLGGRRIWRIAWACDEELKIESPPKFPEAPESIRFVPTARLGLFFFYVALWID